MSAGGPFKLINTTSIPCPALQGDSLPTAIVVQLQYFQSNSLTDPTTYRYGTLQ